MSKFDYERPAATAKRLLTRFGSGGTLTRETEGGYNPATGTVEDGVSKSWTCTAAVIDYNARDIDGTLVQVGDVRVLVAPDVSEAPQAGDKINAAGRTLVAIRVDTLAPSGLPVLYEVQGRG